MTRRARLSLFVDLFLLATASSFCQQHSVIRGIVIDSLSRSPVFDANIVIVGTTLGTGSDSSGHYVVRHVSREWQVVKITHVGFKQFYRVVFIPKDVDTIALNVSLFPAAIPLEGITTVGESRIHTMDRVIARAFVSKEQIQREGVVLMDDVFYKHAPFALYRGYELFVDDFPWPQELLNTINVFDIKEMYVWDWNSAPIQYRFSSGEPDKPESRIVIPSAGSSAPKSMSFASTRRHKPFIVLIRTR
jgi:hypothetical protein